MADTTLTLEGLAAYLTGCLEMQNACGSGAVAIFVCGHDAPDTDALVSTIMEAFRLHTAGMMACPVLQTAGYIPGETRWLLGDRLSALAAQLPSVHSEFVTTRLKERTAVLHLTDFHEIGSLQEYVKAITDHHPLSAVYGPDVSAEYAPVGACATLIARKMKNSRLFPDRDLSRILAGAILADTEGGSPLKVTPTDREMLTYLGWDNAELCNHLWNQFISILLSESNISVLVRRDWRQYGSLGFAVLKGYGETLPRPAQLQPYMEEMLNDNHLTVGLAKLVAYGPDQSYQSDTLCFYGDLPACTRLVRSVLQVYPDCRQLPGNVLVLPAPVSRKKLLPVLQAAL